ncbi:hypothetical protein ACFC1B_29910 [Streptomyces xiamenensis]|uniref:hypothetical protein n=1 Tax=Streptomyces xiamenensis TaxID=408015 RepID=UPI0035E11141
MRRARPPTTVAAAARTRTAEYLLRTRTEAIREALNHAPAPQPTSRCAGHGGTCTGRPFGHAALCLDCRTDTEAPNSPATTTRETPLCPGRDGTPCGRPQQHGMCWHCRTKNLPAADGSR